MQEGVSWLWLGLLLPFRPPTCSVVAQPSPTELHRCQQKRQAAVTHSFHTLWSHSFCLLSLSAGMVACMCQPP